MSGSEAVGWHFVTEPLNLAPQLVRQGDVLESPGTGMISEMWLYDSIERVELGAAKIAPDI